MPVHLRKHTDFNMPQICGATNDKGGLIALLDYLLVESQFSKTCTITRSGTTATITVAGGHGYGTNCNSNTRYITVSGATETEYNLTAALATITGTETMTYTVADNAQASPATGTISVRLAGRAISALTHSTTTAEATCVAHGLGSTGDFAYLTISGSDKAEYNLVNTKVTIVDADTFTYTVENNAQGASAGSPEWKMAAAGWSKTSIDTNKAAYRMPSGTAQFYLYADDDVNAMWTDLNGCESLGGDGLTPTTKFPVYTASHSYSFAFVKANTSYTENKDWTFASNGKCFYLQAKPRDVSAQYYGCGMFFGEFSSVCPSDTTPVCLIANSESTSIASSRAIANIYNRSSLAALNTSQAVNSVNSGHIFARLNNSAGSAVPVFKAIPLFLNAAAANIGSSSTNPTATTDTLNGSLIYLMEPGSAYGGVAANAIHRGFLPGMMAPLHPAAGFYNGQIMEGNGDYSGKKWIVLDSSATSTDSIIALETSDTW